MLGARRRHDQHAWLEPLGLGSHPNPRPSFDADVELVLLGVDVGGLSLAGLKAIEVGVEPRRGGQTMPGERLPTCFRMGRGRSPAM